MQRGAFRPGNIGLRMRMLYHEAAARTGGGAGRQHSAPTATVEMAAGGMHLLWRFPAGTDDMALDAAGRGRGDWRRPRCRRTPWRHDRGPGLLLSFTNIPVEAAPFGRAKAGGARGSVRHKNITCGLDRAVPPACDALWDTTGRRDTAG